MRLKVLGAAREVTGSTYLIETEGSRVLVDCGMHQGRDDEGAEEGKFPFAPGSIDAVLLTHAHMDHGGRIPLLVRQGFRGKIFATSATAELCEVLWRDASHLMREEAEWRNRKNERRGVPPVAPLYDDRDVERAVGAFEPVAYDQMIPVRPDLRVRFRDAGHILGSAILEIRLGGAGSREVKLVFSGDLGPQRAVLERAPSVIEEADFVVIESTYGNRLHKSMEDTRAEFREGLEQALSDRSKVLIPTFVVDRAQRMLYEISLFQEERKSPSFPPIYFDSPMGVKATGIYARHGSLLSGGIQARLLAGEDPFAPKGIRYVSTPDDSRAINQVGHAVVLAGSGMCNGGRIVHHLKHNLWNEKCHVIFVGYQARGTLGRRLVDGEKLLRIAGEEVAVRAKIHTLNGYSAHADRDDLLAWAANFASRPTFLVTHGEPESSESLASALRERGVPAVVPTLGEEFDLLRPERTFEPEPAVPDGRRTAMVLLSEIATLAASLRDTPDGGRNWEKAIPLLQSARILLDESGRSSLPSTETSPG